ncbi:MAG: transporter substrate-binding domain-containing protein, partial [Clostridia bacterium]|nr:transporter substrate-binding domain-containing protein [Clostridia bacterium]
VKADNAEKYSDSTNLAGAVVVAEAGSAGETVATEDALFTDSEFKKVASQATTLLEVKSGTADCAILDYVASIGMIGEGTDYSDLVVLDAYEFAKEEYGIAFRKGDTDLRADFQKAIDELMADGTIQKIAEKYKLEDLLITK